MVLAPRLSSGNAIEPVAARPDALEVGPGSTGAGRKAAIDRIPGDWKSEEPFDRGVGLPHFHRTISVRQSLDHGPLDDAIGEPVSPWAGPLSACSDGCASPRKPIAGESQALLEGLSSVHSSALGRNWSLLQAARRAV